MKVISPGKSKQPWSKELTCTAKGYGGGGCGAVLLVEYGDLFCTQDCDYTGDCDHATTFQCAYCGAWNDIQEGCKTGVPKSFNDWEKLQKELAREAAKDAQHRADVIP